MPKNTIPIFCCFISLNALVQNGNARPLISSAERSTIGSELFEVSGTSFGIKPRATPLRFDQFEGSQNGDLVGSEGIRVNLRIIH